MLPLVILVWQPTIHIHVARRALEADMEAARRLRQQIAADQITTGILATFHLWPGLVEILRNVGYDYMIVDMEHGAHPDDVVAEVCALGRLIDFPVLVRPVAPEYPIVRRAIDLGPCGLMIPCVESAQTLDQVRDSIYMPPRGKRRPGGPGNRWVSDYQYATWRQEVEEDIIVLPQIESRQGLKNVDAIAQHELTTALAIGPYDLSADLGVCWQPHDPRLVEAIRTLKAAAQTAGKKMWMIGDARTSLEQGFTFLCIGEPSMVLEEALRSMNGGAKGEGASG